ncbi:hypothetical protein LCGC14_1637080, partial [marine sediment metagenome]
MTTREDIYNWLTCEDDRRKPHHTHMLVVVDTFDYGDYPVFTDSVHEAISKYHGSNMQRVMEVYNLSMDIDEQLNES